MSVGLPTSKSDIDRLSGSISLDLDGVFARIKRLNAWLLTQTTADLVALGYSTTPVDEVSRLKSAYSDADQLRTIYEGTANLATAKDFRTFLKLLSGPF